MLTALLILGSGNAVHAGPAPQDAAPSNAPPPAGARKSPSDPTMSPLTADQAGERARQQIGGRVINILPQPGGYRVRVLSPDGQVRERWISEHGK